MLRGVTRLVVIVDNLFSNKGVLRSKFMLHKPDIGKEFNDKQKAEEECRLAEMRAKAVASGTVQPCQVCRAMPWQCFCKKKTGIANF